METVTNPEFYTFQPQPNAWNTQTQPQAAWASQAPPQQNIWASQAPPQQNTWASQSQPQPQQKTWTTQALLERIFGKDYDQLKGQTLRMVRVRIPGKEVCLAHVLTPTDPCIYQNLGLHIGVHEGEDHTGEAIGMIRFTPWESVVAAADCAMKAANVEIGFMDRFCGSLILTGRLADVETAVEEVVRFFCDDLHFHTCEVTRS